MRADAAHELLGGPMTSLLLAILSVVRWETPGSPDAGPTVPQLISGYVTGQVSIDGGVSISNWPASYSVTGTLTCSGPLTDAQIRATPVPVSGSVSVGNFPASQAVTGAFYQVTQPVSGTFWPVTQPVSGTFFQATQPVSAAALPLPSGASTEATLALIKAKTDNLDVALSTRAVTGLTDAQARATPLPVSLTGTGGNPCANPYATLASVAGSTSGTSAVQLIALSGATKIYVCSVNVAGVSGTNPTFSLVYGTGNNCATGQTVFLGAWTTAANTIYPFIQPFVTPAGQAVCFLDSGTTPVQRYAITYVQQ